MLNNPKPTAVILFCLACWLVDRWMTQHYGNCHYQEADDE